ncbi:MAG: glycoside hydrolase family 108 protein [Acidiferrobacteraceae bacterium]
MNAITPFQFALTFTLREEGGYVDNPDDPGGATNYGVTQRTYDQFRANHGLAAQSVREILQPEVQSIYYGMYWQPAKCQLMPRALAACQFDWAVQHGPDGAIHTLQAAVGVPQDGVYGPQTQAALAIGLRNLPTLVNHYLDLRREWYIADGQANLTQTQFEKDWLGRVERLRAYVEPLLTRLSLPKAPVC